MSYLQQDPFDHAHVSLPRERQVESFQWLKGLIQSEYRFRDKDKGRDFFIRITGLYKNLNYYAEDSPEYGRYRQEIEDLAAQYSEFHREKISRVKEGRLRTATRSSAESADSGRYFAFELPKRSIWP